MILKSQMPALWTFNDILLVNTILNSGFKVPDEKQITEACNDGVDYRSKSLIPVIPGIEEYSSLQMWPLSTHIFKIISFGRE